MTFHPSGQVSSIVLANAARTDLTFNNRYWPATLVHKDASAQNLVNSTYVYDGVGNTTSITDTANNIYNRTLAYDDIDRLTTTTSTPVWGAGSVTYNGRGDILTQAQGAGFSLTYTYNATSGLLTAVSGSVSYPAITYDVYGNVTGNGVHSFVYDDAPSMTCSNCASASRIDYSYDGKNMRVKSVKSGLTTYSFYGANGNLLFEYDPASTIYSDNVYLKDKLLAKRTPSSTVYLHDDLLGSPMAGTNAAGALAWRENYRPYGSQLLGQGNATNDLWFTGKSLDQDTKLSYLGARYYDTQLGRFMGMDPAPFDEGNLHSVNRYAYGNNNPYKFYDSEGELPVVAIFAPVLVAQVAGAVIAGSVNAAIQYANTGAVQWGGLGGVIDAAGDGAMFGWIGVGAGTATRLPATAQVAHQLSVRSFATRDEARNALGGEMGTAANRFFRDATSKSKDFKISNTEGGGKRLEFFSPAQTDGYGKRYVQDINDKGQVIREFKETVGPSGIIEKKWIHGGPSQ